MAEMKTDAATLAKEAQNFDKISADLKSEMAQVESTAGELASHWQGQASVAAQSALQRFHEAATKQTQELEEISTNISHAGIQYSKADDEQSQALSSQMNF
jgi:WXG100 family type VII secretion target